MSEQTAIPETVTHSEFKEAVQPLLDLLNVTDESVWPNIHITPPGSGAVSHAVITVAVVARKADDESTCPEGVVLADAPQQHAELCHYVTVEVV